MREIRTVRHGTWVRCALLLCALPVLSACASSGSGSSGGSSSRDVITAEEIQAAPPGDGYQVVQRLRPRWLQPRGASGTPQVRIDGRVVQGGIQALRQLRGTDIQEVRFIDARDATTQLGTGFPAGLIDVITRG